MEKKVICLDTSILIDFFRKTKKEKSLFYELTKHFNLFAVSVITEFEIFCGSNSEQDLYWNKFFENIVILPYNSETNKIAIKIERELKKKGKQIDIPDLMIAATALANNMKLATFNKKHFEKINNLEIISEK